MIKDIDLKRQHSYGHVDWFGNGREQSGVELLETKINEIIQVLNALTYHQDRMIGCETLDIPESYIKSCRMDKEFAEEEYKRLQDELDRTRKALDKAKWWLNEIVESHRFTPISTAEIALKEITALEQKD